MLYLDLLSPRATYLAPTQTMMVLKISADSISGGNLPWQTLGLGNTDVWGNRFRYYLREEFGRRPPLSTIFTLSTTASIRVCSVVTCTPASNVLTSTAVAVVLSHGKNGLNTTNTDELENIDLDRNIVSRVTTTDFDDIVVWIPQYTLFNRMIAAGKLP
jgi:hypothetical protein